MITPPSRLLQAQPLPPPPSPGTLYPVSARRSHLLPAGSSHGGPLMFATRFAVVVLAASLSPLEAADRLTSRPRPAAPADKPLAVGSSVRTRPGEQRLVRLPDRSAVFVRENTALTVQSDSTVELTS